MHALYDYTQHLNRESKVVGSIMCMLLYWTLHKRMEIALIYTVELLGVDSPVIL